MIESPTAPSSVRTVPASLPVAAVVAAVVNVAILLVGRALGVSMIAPAGGDRVGVAPVLVMTIVMFALGAGLLWLVARRRPTAVPALAWVGLGLGVVSVVQPLLLAQDLPTGLTLASMHVVAGVAWFVGLRRAGRAAR